MGDERRVGMAGVQLLLDRVDGLDQVILVAAGEGHAGDGVLYGHQGLVNRGLLRCVHTGRI